MAQTDSCASHDHVSRSDATKSPALPVQQDLREIAVPTPQLQAPTPVNLNQEQLLQLFEEENYPELYQQRLALNNQIRDLDTFFRDLQKSGQAHSPNICRCSRNCSTTAITPTANSSRRISKPASSCADFWVHYSTGNSADAINKFNPVASALTRQIQSSLALRLEDRKQEERLLREHMSAAGAALKSNRIPTQLAGRITAYTGSNRNRLLEWLRRYGPSRTLNVLERLAEERTLIRNRIQQLQSFRKRYPDLVRDLDRTLALWNQAIESNYFAEYRLLYAVEALYVADQLALDSAEAASKRLNADLNAYTELAAGHAEDALEKAEQSYQPPRIKR
ncbi:MAG: hypothetical protein R3E95_02960 [Thiolinea sp.]